jgi:hypothetical protein
MTNHRRTRPTIRCLTQDLGLALPALDVDLGQLGIPWLAELRRIAPTSPRGQKRILSIDYPLLYRLRVSTHRGATWVDEDNGIVWLCAVHRRDDDSEDDAYAWFSSLHTSGQLLPSDDDRLRDRAEAAIRLQRGLTAALLQLADDAVSQRGTELREDLGAYIPCRMLVIDSSDIQEIWCALSVRATDGTHVPDPLKDLLFAALEEHYSSAVFEVRPDWPTGTVAWFEIVRLGLR